MMYFFIIILLIIVCRYYYKRNVTQKKSVTDTLLSEKVKSDVSKLFLQEYFLISDKYRVGNKCRVEFTMREIAEIEELLRSLRLASSSEQKRIRQKLRNIGFYISDYGIGLTVERFRNMVAIGKIKVIKNDGKKIPNSSVNEKKNSNILSKEYSCKSLSPIVFYDSYTLILGTMPGNESLKTGEYYASSSNSFWKIIETIYNKGYKFANYEEKIACLKKNHISLWDVYKQCDRPGSLDTSISNEILNDIDSFLSEHRSIKRIVFNGKKAASAYLPKIECSVLCSTSNSNTRLSFAAKVEEWRKCLNSQNK